MDYTLDTAAAKKADSFNARIEQTGKYLGAFSRAEQVTSKKGTKGVDFSFKAESGESADYLTIWTHKEDGTQLQGFNTLMAIMTCLRVKSLSAEAGEVEKYDATQQKRVKVSANLFKDLMNKPIGLLLQMEEYEKTAGGTAWKPSIFAAFDQNEFTASEILSQAKTQETLAKMVSSLKDKPLKHASQSTATANHSSPGVDFADDLPF